MSPLTIAISGLPGSGKSTAARMLQAGLGGDVIAFGDYVRHLAKERGAPSDRNDLQEIGDSEVRRDPAAFVCGFLAWAAPKPACLLIIDGVRHVMVDEALRDWAVRARRPYMRLHLSASKLLRARRRTGGDVATLEAIDDHCVERDASDGLAENADLCLDGEMNGESIILVIETTGVLKPDVLPRSWHRPNKGARPRSYRSNGQTGPSDPPIGAKFPVD